MGNRLESQKGFSLKQISSPLVPKDARKESSKEAKASSRTALVA
jgi:hypothetical protein